MDIADRLKKARISKGYRTARAAADAMGVPYGTYSGHEGGTRGIKPGDVERYAKFFGVDLAWLQFGRGSISPAPEAPKLARFAPVRGQAQAGAWIEVDAFVDDPELIPLINAVRYQGIEQFSFRVVGPSMDKARIFDGDYVICVPYFDARARMTNDDIVVVERRRGCEIERTVKQLVVKPDVIELWPRSSHPNFQKPLIIEKNFQADDGIEVEIVGLVIWTLSPR